MGRSSPTRGRTSSTSAASRPGPGRRRSASRRRSRGPSRSSPTSRRSATRSRSTPRSGGRRGGARRRRRDRQRRHRAARRSRDRRRSAPTAGASSSSCTCRGPRGRCRTSPTYDDVVDDVRAFLAERIEAAVAAGVAEERIWVDPGIGFGKTLEHNLELLRRLGELRELGRPIVVGTSRKSFIGKIDGSGADERIGGTIASSVLAVADGRRRAPRPRRRRGRPGDEGRRGDPRVGSAHGGARKRDRVERRGRAARPLDLHPPRGQRRRAGGRAAARVRRLLRRPRLRRGAHRPARGHGRLRRGLRHRRPRRDRAQLPDPGAPRPGRRRAADGALRLRLGPGPGGEARAAAAARDPGGRGRGRPGAHRKRGRGRGRE